VQALDLASDQDQLLTLGIGQRPGARADRAKRADRQLAFGRLDRHSRVEPNPRPADHEWIVDESRVLKCVLEDKKRIGLKDRMAAKGHVATCLRRFEPKAGFEPLAVFVHEGNEGNLRSQYQRDQPSQLVVSRFAIGVQDAKSAKLRDALLFSGMFGRCLHRQSERAGGK
jgi:hypothetical protein